ncbi:MAG: DJ-1/PfpI family protein [Clostridia bacterium]|nr:DJ-1/PfpI family protein [Clostridia bacterium]
MIAVFLADGFEEIEALAVVDILRRAELSVLTVGVGTDTPTGAHGISVCADVSEDALDMAALSAVVLPGGMPGTLNLEKSAVVQQALAFAMDQHLPVAAICAAPSILGHAGYLNGLHATCYPGFESELGEGIYEEAAVVTDGTVTTAAGAGVAVDFALELARRLATVATADDIRRGIQCR